MLARSASEMRIADIILAVDEPIKELAAPPDRQPAATPTRAGA